MPVAFAAPNAFGPSPRAKKMSATQSRILRDASCAQVSLRLKSEANYVTIFDY
jgi:hypothetical protein